MESPFGRCDWKGFFYQMKSDRDFICHSEGSEEAGDKNIKFTYPKNTIFAAQKNTRIPLLKYKRGHPLPTPTGG